MAYYKPQSPLKIGNNFYYPLTTYDQIINRDGSRVSEIVNNKSIPYLYSGDFKKDDWNTFFSKTKNEWEVNGYFFDSNIIDEYDGVNFSTFENAKIRLSSGKIPNGTEYLQDDIFFESNCFNGRSFGAGTYATTFETQIISSEKKTITWRFNIGSWPTYYATIIYGNNSIIKTIKKLGIFAPTSFSISFNLEANVPFKLQIVQLIYTNEENSSFWNFFALGDNFSTKISSIAPYMSATTPEVLDCFSQISVLTPIDNGNNVNGKSIIVSPAMFSKTESEETNKVSQSILSLFNLGYSKIVGENQIASFVFEKPTSDITVIWSITN